MSILGNIGKSVTNGVAKESNINVIRWPATDEQRAASNDIIAYRYPEENFVRGSIVQVEHSQIALFFNEGGTAEGSDQNKLIQQVIPIMPGNTEIETLISNLVGVREKVNARADGESIYHNYLYFINCAEINEIGFGTSNPVLVQAYDTVPYTEKTTDVHVTVHGTFIAKIDGKMDNMQAIRFMEEIVGSDNCVTKQKYARKMGTWIKKILIADLANIINNLKKSIKELSGYYGEIADEIKQKFSATAMQYGILIREVAIEGIDFTDEDREKIDKLVYENQLKESESVLLARKRAREGYTYQQERGFDVLKTAAANEATPGQFMGAGMGLGLGVGVGGAFGAAMGNMAQNTFGSMNSPQGYYPPNGYYQQQNGQYAPNGYYQQQNGQYAPGGSPQQPNGQYAPGGYPQQPNGQYAPGGSPQQPNGQYAPGGYPQQPNGQYAPGGYPQQPNGQYAPGGYPQQPNGQYAPGGYPQQPNGQYAPGGQPAPAQTQEEQPSAENGQPAQPQQQQAPAFKKCPLCGADIPQNAMFCMYCGGKLDKKEGE